MRRRLNPKEIKEIVFDYRNRVMKIYNKSNHLVYDEVVSENFFNKTVCKFLDGLEQNK
ncbi:hypothetical protein H0A43_07355 [Arcobacter lanthieri]|uniref:hypothetical protein n=1 Tax=Aliarcobacter lanthieri TaxID=1355374 RepID=UPI0019229C11|nr:hypothetical protein [Aliarcobacter lanthieri]MBL3520288.1 hypothetical protein [Aliarcobacter lanthieri]